MLCCVYQNQCQPTSVNTPSGATDFLNTLSHTTITDIETLTALYGCVTVPIIHATRSLVCWYEWECGMMCQDNFTLVMGHIIQTVPTMLYEMAPNVVKMSVHNTHELVAMSHRQFILMLCKMAPHVLKCWNTSLLYIYN